MKAVGVIPARWGSTRFPGKSLALLGGRAIVLRVVERVACCERLDRVVVATDDERIARVVRDAGYDVAMTSAEHVSGTDRVAEAVFGLDADLVVNIQGDEPFIEPKLVDRLVDVLAGGSGWDAATAAFPIRSEAELMNPAVVKVVLAGDGAALYFSRATIPFQRDGLAEFGSGLYLHHVGVYAYTRSFLTRFVAAPPCALELTEKLEQLRALHMGARMRVLLTEYEGVGIDTPADLAYAESVVSERGY